MSNSDKHLFTKKIKSLLIVW